MTSPPRTNAKISITVDNAIFDYQNEDVKHIISNKDDKVPELIENLKRFENDLDTVAKNVDGIKQNYENIRGLIMEIVSANGPEQNESLAMETPENTTDTTAAGPSGISRASNINGTERFKRNTEDPENMENLTSSEDLNRFKGLITTLQNLTLKVSKYDYKGKNNDRMEILFTNGKGDMISGVIWPDHMKKFGNKIKKNRILELQCVRIKASGPFDKGNVNFELGITDSSAINVLTKANKRAKKE